MADTVANARKKKSNKSCADCGIRSVTYASIKFSIFLCTECASAHLHFAFKTKGLSESRFTDIEALNLAKVGNKRSNAHYLALYKESDFPKLTVRSDGGERQTFVDLKYKQKRWIAKDSSPSTPTPAALAMPKRAAAARRARGSSGSAGGLAVADVAAVAEAAGRTRGNSGGGRRGSARTRGPSGSGAGAGKLQIRMGIASTGRARGSSASKPGRLGGPRGVTAAAAPVRSSRGEGSSAVVEPDMDLFDSGAPAGGDGFGFDDGTAGDVSGGEEQASSASDDDDDDDGFGFDDAPAPAPAPVADDDGFGFDDAPAPAPVADDDGFGFDDAPAPAPVADDDGFGFDDAPAPAPVADDDGFGFDDDTPAVAAGGAGGDLGDLFSSPAPAPAPSPEQHRGRARAASKEAGKKILGDLGGLYEAAAAERAQQAAAAHAAAMHQQQQAAYAAQGYGSPAGHHVIGGAESNNPFGPMTPTVGAAPHAYTGMPPTHGGGQPALYGVPVAGMVAGGQVPLDTSLNNPFGMDDSVAVGAGGVGPEPKSNEPDPFANILDMDAAASTFQPTKPGSRAQAHVTPGKALAPTPAAAPMGDDLFGAAPAAAPAAPAVDDFFGAAPAPAPTPAAPAVDDFFGAAPAPAPAPAPAAAANPFDMF